MRILSIDLARCTGFAIGEAGTKPRARSVELAPPSTDQHIVARSLGVMLRDQFFRFRDEWPDIIVVENFQHPSSKFNRETGETSGLDSVVAQVLLHGTLDGIAGCYGIDVRRVAPATARVHFCGRASAMPPKRGTKRTKAEAAAARKATKDMVITQCHLLGYMPRHIRDDNVADALCMFSWASATIARTAPADFALTAGATV